VRGRWEEEDKREEKRVKGKEKKRGKGGGE